MDFFKKKPTIQGKCNQENTHIVLKNFKNIKFDISEQIKTNEKQLRKVDRDVERDRRGLEREEKKLEQEIKKAVKYVIICQSLSVLDC